MIPSLSRRLLAAAVLVSTAPVAFSGIMDPDIGVQTYRDFAENRGAFAAGATNVTVYDSSGAVVGTIARVASFDSVVDGGWSALTGGASFLATVAHNNATDVTFGTRFGATSGTAFYDTYHVVNYNRAWGTSGSSNYDYAAPRLNKIVTEAVAVPYLTDTTILNTMTGRDVLRVGGGTQTYATGSGTETTLTGAYAYLTGGTITYTSETVRIPNATSLPANGNGVTYQNQTVDPNAPGSNYNSYSFIYYNQAADASQPLDIGIRSGDSGSASWTYNPNTQRWEYVGAGQSGGGSGYGSLNQMRSGNGYAVATILAYNSPTITPAAGGGNITWGTPDGTGAGTLTQGATTWSYIGLASNVRGATSTVAADGSSTTAATDAQMDATRNLVLAGSGGTIVLGGSIDMGAGSLTFNSNYTLTNGGVTTRRLNSAGFIVSGGVAVTSNLTGAAGDEWRVVSDAINGNTALAGSFTIGGSGTNNADLNIGGNMIVYLNRTGGAAAQDVKINGGAAAVRLLGSNQIGGDVIFGNRGGMLDLYGNNWTTDHITHLDSGAEFSNLKASTTSTFTFTGSGAQTYLGQFTDGGSVANGAMALVYNPTTAAGASWTLNGVSAVAGGVTVSGGNLILRGANTLHAGGYVDPNDWTYASISTGTIAVGSGATFTLADHARLDGNVTVAAGGTFAITENLFKSTAESVEGAQPGTPSSSLYGHRSGTVTLSGSTAAMVATISGGTDQNVAYARNITGTGSFTKNGAGTLTLSGTNTFSGAKTINGGALLATSVSALGDTSTNKWNLTSAGSVIGVTGATAATVKGNLTTGSVGTLALAGTNPDAAPNLTGYSGLYLGAIGAQTVGTAGTSSTLTAWNGTGWNLGGGGGALTMNLKLSGAGTLNVGNGANRGVVVLTNANNNTTTGGAAFTGAINVNAGVRLEYTDINALGSFSGGDRIAVAYGAKLLLGTGANAVTVFNGVTTASQGVLMLSGSDANAYSFSAQGLNAAALGADGAATYSGTLTAGTGGYKFGGDGALTVSSVLSGANALSADGQGASGGVTTLSGANTFTGTVTVQGGTLGGVTGAHTLKLGSNTGIGTGNAVVLNDGATLDVNGKTVSIGTLTGTAASALTNASGTAATLTLNEASSTTLAGAISGAIALVKNGAGTLTLSGANTRTGAVTINAGAIKLGSSTALGAAANAVTVASGGTLDVAGFGLANNISIAGTGASGLAAIYNSSSTAGSSIGTLTLTADATLGGAVNNNTGTGINATGINLAGKTLTITSGRLSMDGTDAFTGGGNVAVNSGGVLYLQGNGAGSGSGVTITIKSGGTLDARDYQNAALAAYPAVVLDGGTLGNALLGSNGGGAGTILYNGVNVTANGGTLTGANTAFGIYLRLAGALTGSGALTLNGGKGVEFQGDTSAYTGTATATAGTVSFNPTAATQTFAGVLAGSRPVVKNGANTTIFTGANTYTGATTVSAGTLQIGNGGTTGALGTGTVSVASGATLALNRSNAFTVANVLSGAGTLVKNGAGVATLSGTNTYTGGTTINAGAIAIAEDAGLGATTGALTLDGGALRVTAAGRTLNAARGVVLGASGGALDTSTISGANITTTVAGVVSGSGALTIASTGNMSATGGGDSGLGVRLANTGNTFTGDVTITSGLVSYAGDGAFGNAANAIVLNGGGLLDNNVNVALTRNIRVLSGGGTLRVWGSVTPNWSGAITGSGNLNKTDGGGLILSGDLSGYTGTYNQLGGNTSLTGASGTIGGDWALSTGALTVDNTASRSLAGTISGTGSLVKNGAGELTLVGANTYSGGTTLAAGTVRVSGSDAALGTGALAVTGNTLLATASGGGARNIANAVTVASGTTLSLDGGYAALTLSGAVSGAGNLATSSTGTVVLAGTNTYAGTTSVSSVGTLQVGAGGAAGTLGAGAVANAGSLVFNRSGTLAVANTISGAGSVTQTGSGTTVLSGANTYAGTTTISAGTLQVGAGGTSGSLGTGAVVDNAALAFNRSDAITVANAVSGTGSVSQTGSGNTTLTGANTYTGGTTVAAGTLTLGNASALGSSSGTLAVSGGTLDLGAYTVTSGALTLTGGAVQNGTLTATGYATSAGTVSAVLAGTGALTQNGAGTTTLSGANTYSGGTTVAAGTLTLGNASALGSSSAALAVSGGTLDLGAYTVTSGALTLTGGAVQNGTLTATGYATSAGTVSAALAGTGALTQNGAGTTVLSGANTYTGATTVTAGTLQIGAGGTAGTLGTAAANVASGATLAFNRSDNLTVTNALNGAGTVVQNGTGNLTLNNTAAASLTTYLTVNAGTVTITGGGFGANRMNGSGLVTVNAGASLVITGAHALGGSNGGMTESVTLNGGSMTLNNEQYFNTLTLNGGTTGGSGQLRASNATNWTAGGTSASTIANGIGLYNTANFNVADATSSPATDLTVSGTIVSPSGYTGAVTKTGAGTLAFTGANTYTTATTVNGGTLLAGSNSAFGTGTVNVNNGGTLNLGGRTLANTINVASGGVLAGAGTLTGTINVASGGTLSPGGAIGILTANNGVTLASGAAFLWEIAGTGGVAGVDFDRLVVAGGTGSLAGTVLKISAAGIDYTAAYWDTTRSFDIVTKSGTGALSGGFASLDTSGAGAFTAEGSWSVATGSGGVQQAVWTAGSSLMSGGSPQAVPEPSTYGLLGAGALAAAALVRRRRRKV